MIYLNDVQEGGQTLFHRLGKCYQPKAGFALAWNNLCVDGRLNRDTLHESLPVRGGKMGHHQMVQGRARAQ